MQSLRDYLNEKIPIFLEENDVSASLSFDVSKEDPNLLTLTKRSCTIGLRDDLCKWLGLKKSDSVLSEEFDFARIFSPYQDYLIFDEENHITNSGKSLGEAIVPKVIKIEIADLHQSFKSFTYNKILSLIPYKHIVDNSVFYHNIKSKEYFALNNSNLQSLSVRLLDQDNKTIKIFGEQPTLLDLAVRKMKHTSFIMRISSQDCISLFPGNKPSNFRSQLIEGIDLSTGQWEVALSSIILPQTIDVKDMLTQEDFWIEINTLNNLNVDRRIDFIHDNIRNLKDLKESINAKIKDMIGEAKFYLDYTYDNKTAIRCFQPMSFTLSEPLSYVLGRADNNKLVIQSPRTLFSAREANLDRCKPSTGFLHCDFITPSILGNKYAKVLKMIPLNSSLGTFECQHLNFIPINTNNLSTMHFQLTDDNGNVIKFSKENNDDILINLVFEQKRK
jgi:hypothetical protein